MNKIRTIITIILTIICVFATNKLWLDFKPFPVSFTIGGNGQYQITALLNKKDNNSFKKVKVGNTKLSLHNVEQKAIIYVKRAKFPKRLKLDILPDITTVGQTFYISDFFLNKNLIKINSEEDFLVKNAEIKVVDKKLYITPTNKEKIEIIFNTPLNARCSISFKFHIFLFFLILPCLFVYYVNRYKNELFDYFKKFLNYCKNNKKLVAISLLLAIVFTLLTPHWWVKGKYWQNKINFTSLCNLKIRFSNSTHLDSGTYLTSNLNYILNNKDFTYFVEATNEPNNNFIIYSIKNFVPVGGKIFNANFLVNTKNNLEFILPHNFDITSFKINNIEYIKNFDNNGILTLKNLYGQKINLSYNVNLQYKKVSLFSNIAYFNLLLSFFIYFMFINFILSKKNKLNSIIFFIKKHKIGLVLFLMLFLFYMLLNNYAIYHTNYCYGNASTVRISSILSHKSVRYHIYWFLPFYPIFDLMLLLTKNITFTLMSIYSLLTCFTVLFVYKILKNINPKMYYINFILTLIFGFSYVVTTNYYIFDTYTVTAFYLSLIILLLVRELTKKNFNKITIFTILFIIVLSFGVTVSNLITLFLLTFTIFLIKTPPKTLINYSLIILFEFFLFFVCMANITSGNIFITFDSSSNKNNVAQWVFDKRLRNGFSKQTLRMPMLAQDKKYSIILMNSFWVGFAILILLSLVLLFKSSIKREEKLFYISLLLALLYNFVANYFWDQGEGFKFSPNHFSLWFVIFAYCLKIIDEELKKHKMTVNNNFVIAILILFLLVEVPTNYITNKKIQNDEMKQYPLTTPIIEVIK